MADTDADSLLLDRIDGKYGQEGDYDDLDNADEDALLEGDNIYDDHASNENANDYQRENDNYYNDVDEGDILDLEAQDVELDDLEDINDSDVPNSLAVSSTTTHDLDTSDTQLERERSTKFTSERQQVTKLGNIPDSLDEVPIERNSNNNNRGQFRGRGRGSNFRNQKYNRQKQTTDNKTVLINPHFKGQVKINNDSRLAWDARQRLNERQVNTRGSFGPNSRKRGRVQPWINKEIVVNNQQFQEVSTPFNDFQPPQPISVWNRYPGNSYNQQIPNQQLPMIQQQVFMQPFSQPVHNVYANQQPSQYNQPIQQYNPPMYQNHNMNPGYNEQFISSLQYNRPPEPLMPNFSPNQPPPGYIPPHENPFIQPQYHQPQLINQYTPPPQERYISPPTNPFSRAINVQIDNAGPSQDHFNKQNRFNRPNSNFNNAKKFNKSPPLKRRADVDVRKKKRNLSLSNLHEVQTVEIPDTTVAEDKQIEEEDEEMRLYRKKIEEQKKLREKILADKEKRRQEAILNKSTSNATAANVESGNAQQQQNRGRSIPPFQVNQPNLVQLKTAANIRVINTDSEEFNYNKQHISSFLSNRKILAKDQSLIDTSIVVVSNLAAGTTDVKLRKLCQGIGDIKKLQMSPKERQATIQFNSVASAHAFFKKFQRSMLDLSMIQVALQPMSF